jgi:cellulose 1,4-beta-cellobiosidase
MRVDVILVFCFSVLAVVNAQVVGTNPFLGGKYYVNPSYVAELQTSINTESDSTIKSTLTKMQSVASAYWIDVKAKITGNDTSSLQGILTDATAKGQLTAFIVYDLPNRDCHAKASNGEICCYYNADKTCNYDQSGDCAQGLQEYETTYIQPFASVLKQFNGKAPIVLFIEPDSLPNLATNMGDPHCGNTATVTAYKTGVPYAVNTLSAACPACTIYLDAAHGGWLGWQNNMQQYVQIVQQLNIASKIRGFATNIANYQPIGQLCPNLTSNGQPYCLVSSNQGQVCCSDPCHEESQYNPGNNELNYIANLDNSFKNAGISGKQYVIDSGRNGVPNMRSDCANWCNIRNAGVGLQPTTNTGATFVDAYYWLKTPGESDGCTQQLPDGSTCSRYDSMCGSSDSIGSQSGEPRAPVAGNWFDYQVKQLANYSVWK